MSIRTPSFSSTMDFHSQSFLVTAGIYDRAAPRPMLFLVAVEVLAIAIQQNAKITGVDIHQGGNQTIRHTFSAFVDESTVFFRTSKDILRLSDSLEDYRAKSKFIFLNKAITKTEWHGVLVIKLGDSKIFGLPDRF